MKVKVFESNQKGKVEFTRAELEKLLNEIYMDGYREGEAHRSNTWTWTTPYSNYADCMTNAITSDSTSNNTISISGKECADYADGALASKSTSIGKVTATTAIDNAKATNVNAVYIAPEDAVKITADTKSTYCIEDFITKLAKELNF